MVIGARHFCNGAGPLNPCGFEVFEHDFHVAAAAPAGGAGAGGAVVAIAPVAHGPLAPPVDPTVLVMRDLDAFASRPVLPTDIRIRDVSVACLRVAFFDGTQAVMAFLLTNNGILLLRTFTLDPTLTGVDLQHAVLRLRQIRLVGIAFLTLFKLHEKYLYATSSPISRSRHMVVKRADVDVCAEAYVVEVLLANAERVNRTVTLAETAPPPAEYGHDYPLYYGLYSMSLPPNVLFRDTHAVIYAKVEDTKVKFASTFIDQATWAAKAKGSRQQEIIVHLGSPSRAPKRTPDAAGLTQDPHSPSKRARSRAAREARIKERIGDGPTGTDATDTSTIIAATPTPPTTPAPHAGRGGGGGGRGRGGGGRGHRGGFRWTPR